MLSIYALIIIIFEASIVSSSVRNDNLPCVSVVPVALAIWLKFDFDDLETKSLIDIF